MTKHCFTCGNHGPEEGTCVECGRESKKLSLENATPKDVVMLMTKAKDVLIPDEYHGVEWSPGLLRKYKPRDYNDILLEKYINQLTEMHDKFALGQVPYTSAFINAPATYSKATFAYSCMQHALKHGYSVAPVIDTMDLKRLLVLGAENVNYKLFKHIQYDEYMTSDVLFINVTKLEYRFQAYVVLDELIGKRSRMGLATFVLSRFNLDTLVKWDKQQKSGRWEDAQDNDNYLKFPAQIVYKEPE